MDDCKTTKVTRLIEESLLLAVRLSGWFRKDTSNHIKVAFTNLSLRNLHLESKRLEKLLILRMSNDPEITTFIFSGYRNDYRVFGVRCQQFFEIVDASLLSAKVNKKIYINFYIPKIQ